VHAASHATEPRTGPIRLCSRILSPRLPQHLPFNQGHVQLQGKKMARQGGRNWGVFHVPGTGHFGDRPRMYDRMAPNAKVCAIDARPGPSSMYWPRARHPWVRDRRTTPARVRPVTVMKARLPAHRIGPQPAPISWSVVRLRQPTQWLQPMAARRLSSWGVCVWPVATSDSGMPVRCRICPAAARCRPEIVEQGLTSMEDEVRVPWSTAMEIGFSSAASGRPPPRHINPHTSRASSHHRAQGDVVRSSTIRTRPFASGRRDPLTDAAAPSWVFDCSDLE